MDVDSEPGGLNERVSEVLKDILFLGNMWEIQSGMVRKKYGITHVLSICREMLEVDLRHLLQPVSQSDAARHNELPSADINGQTGWDLPYPRHLVIDVEDDEKADIAAFFDTTFDFIDWAISYGGRVYVHCALGISRGPTVVAAYLIRKQGLNATEALDRIRLSREFVMPNDGFMRQLNAYATQCNGSWGAYFQTTLANASIYASSATTVASTASKHASTYFSNRYSTTLKRQSTRNSKDLPNVPSKALPPKPLPDMPPAPPKDTPRLPEKDAPQLPEKEKKPIEKPPPPVPIDFDDTVDRYDEEDAYGGMEEASNPSNSAPGSPIVPEKKHAPPPIIVNGKERTPPRPFLLSPTGRTVRPDHLNSPPSPVSPTRGSTFRRGASSPRRGAAPQRKHRTALSVSIPDVVFDVPATPFVVSATGSASPSDDEAERRHLPIHAPLSPMTPLPESPSAPLLSASQISSPPSPVSPAPASPRSTQEDLPPRSPSPVPTVAGSPSSPLVSLPATPALPVSAKEPAKKADAAVDSPPTSPLPPTTPLAFKLRRTGKDSLSEMEAAQASREKSNSVSSKSSTPPTSPLALRSRRPTKTSLSNSEIPHATMDSVSSLAPDSFDGAVDALLASPAPTTLEELDAVDLSVGVTEEDKPPPSPATKTKAIIDTPMTLEELDSVDLEEDSTTTAPSSPRSKTDTLPSSLSEELDESTSSAPTTLEELDSVDLDRWSSSDKVVVEEVPSTPSSPVVVKPLRLGKTHPTVDEGQMKLL